MAAAAAFPASNRAQAKDTFVIGAEGDPVLLDPLTRLRRHVASDHVPDLRGPRAQQARDAHDRASARNGLEGLEERPRLDVHAAQGREVHGRNTVQLGRRLRELHTLVVPARHSSRAMTSATTGTRSSAATRSRRPVATGPDKSLYHGCKTAGPYDRPDHPHHRRSSSFLGALALANFGIASPTALKKYKADAGTVGADGLFRPSGTFATQNPIGTGAVQAPVVEDRRQARPRPQRQVLGPEGQDEDGHPPADLGHNGARARRCRRVRSTSRTTSRRRMSRP